MNNSIKKWYALYTKPGCEKKVANTLSRRNIENYCPLKRHLNSRKKVILEPLFESYVFVNIDNQSDMSNIRTTDCVINFVYWLGKPAVIQAEEIEIMKRFMNEYANVKMEKIPFNVDGMVRVIGEPLAESKIHMISVKNNIVKIVLPSLGYIMLADVEKSNIEAITLTTKSYSVTEKYNYAI